MTLVETVKTQISAQVAALTGVLEEVAELSALVQQNALPQRLPAGFVIPLGCDGREPDAAAGLYRQSFREVIGVVLVAESAGDPKAKRALVKIDTLKDAVIAALAGWAPAEAIGVFVLLRGRLVSVVAGTVFYQLDFALDDQLRITR
jgi:hypothetical protein